MAIRDVLEHAVRVGRETAAATPKRPSRVSRVLLLIVCVAALAFSAYSFIAKPEYIWGPSVPPEIATSEIDLRLGMYLLARRIEDFHSQSGEYPARLGDIGEAVQGIEYQVLGDTLFELRGHFGGDAVVLRSDQPPDSFLRASGTLPPGGVR